MISDSSIDPLTAREVMGHHTKRPHFRKTKSLEKIKNQKIQAKKYANFFAMKEHNLREKEKGSAIDTIENESRLVYYLL